MSTALTNLEKPQLQRICNCVHNMKEYFGLIFLTGAHDCYLLTFLAIWLMSQSSEGAIRENADQASSLNKVVDFVTVICLSNTGYTKKDKLIYVTEFITLRLIHLMDSKMRFIKARLKESGEPAEKERAFVSHFKHVSDFMSSNLYPSDDVVEATALIVDVVLEDSQVPNRAEIKARSLEIYTEATRNPFEVVEPKGKKGKKK